MNHQVAQHQSPSRSETRHSISEELQRLAPFSEHVKDVLAWHAWNEHRMEYLGTWKEAESSSRNVGFGSVCILSMACPAQKFATITDFPAHSLVQKFFKFSKGCQWFNWHDWPIVRSNLVMLLFWGFLKARRWIWQHCCETCKIQVWSVGHSWGCVGPSGVAGGSCCRACWLSVVVGCAWSFLVDIVGIYRWCRCLLVVAVVVVVVVVAVVAAVVAAAAIVVLLTMKGG